MAHADSSTEVRHNKLLAALPDCEREWLQRTLQRVLLRKGQVLYEAGAKPEYAYFPTTAIVALEYLTAEGAFADFAIVGNEGLVGIALFMGGDSRPNRAVVQIQGWAYRLRSDVLTQEFARGNALQHLMLLYTQSLITLTAQTVVCNRHHSVDQQLCRWLLLALDRLPSHELTTTHELMAKMLGVRRESVTAAVGKLQRVGVIRHDRGHITVVDRPALERLSCECYAVVKKETDRLLPYPPGLAATRGGITRPESASSQKERGRQLAHHASLAPLAIAAATASQVASKALRVKPAPEGSQSPDFPPASV